MVRAPNTTARPVMRGPCWPGGAWGVDLSGVSGCVDNLALASAKIGNLWNEALAERKISAKQLRESYPNYFISKNKIQLPPEINVDEILKILAEKYKNEQITTIDGLKIDFEDGWVHLRKSNTEPIIRIYAESEGKEKANSFAEKMINEIKNLI